MTNTITDLNTAVTHDDAISTMSLADAKIARNAANDALLKLRKDMSNDADLIFSAALDLHVLRLAAAEATVEIWDRVVERESLYAGAKLAVELLDPARTTTSERIAYRERAATQWLRRHASRYLAPAQNGALFTLMF